MSHTLPARPSLDQLKKQAKELLAAVRAGESAALARFARHHPAKNPAQPFALHDAQLVLAREHGFPGWSQLKDEVEHRLSTFAEKVKRFIDDAVGERYLRARAALQVEPTIADANIWTRLVLGDAAALTAAIRHDKSWIKQTGGPRETWHPLHYICFSRFQQDDPARFRDCAQLLLDAGADANAAWFHPSWPDAPLSALYGATGENNNPLLARLLLERGASVNDGESLYHAAEHYHRESLEVLQEFHASTGLHPFWKNTPLYFLVGYNPNHGNWPKTRQGIRWLLDAGCDPDIPCGKNADTALLQAVRQGHSEELIQSLLTAGANPNQSNTAGELPVIEAHRIGRKDLVSLLRQHGANEPELSANQQFFGAAFSGDETKLRELLAPGLSFTEDERLALPRAAELGNTAAVRLLLDAGFDINFKGSRPWGATPLHMAAWNGWAETVELLLSRGADISIPANPPETSLPLGWAVHGSLNCRNARADYAQVIRLLLAAGAEAYLTYTENCAPEVADILHAAVAGKTP